MMDVKIYVDIDVDLWILCRFIRDIKECGCIMELVIN